jgi:murein DD-endopeptidase MepM/ murein hydrolase activator NlpD
LVTAALLGASSTMASAKASNASALIAEVPSASESLGIVETYTVQPGDSLLGIASIFATDVQRIQDLNDIANPDSLVAGHVLVVPDAPNRPVQFGLAPSAAKVNKDGISFVWPAIGPITTPFGVKGSDWVEGFHTGLDIGAPEGSPIVAAAGGTVEWSAPDKLHGYGNYVLIDHGKGYETLYAHMSRVACKPGDIVRQGDLIGYVGQTGYAFGPHLHFEVRYLGQFVDPEPFLP